MIIGITGTFGAGKDTVAHYLESLGFEHISTGELVRQEMAKLDLPLDRQSQQDFANEMRQERGPGYLAAEALRKITGNAVVSGLRNVEEVRLLRQGSPDRFLLVAVDAPPRLRWERARARGRLDDSVSFEQFQSQEAREHGSGLHEQQLLKVMAEADVTLTNDGTVEELQHKIDQVLAAEEKVE